LKKTKKGEAMMSNRGEYSSTYFVQDRNNQEELKRLIVQDQMLTANEAVRVAKEMGKDPYALQVLAAPFVHATVSLGYITVLISFLPDLSRERELCRRRSWGCGALASLEEEQTRP
jgi:hypothetical protein